MGVTFALPFLDSMAPAQTPTAKTAANAAPRFLAVVSSHGWSPTYWADNRSEVAATEGRNVGLGFIHKPLEPFQDQLTICSGLDATAAMPPQGSTGGDHARLAASLTGAPPRKTGGPDIKCGVSVDQVIAQKYGQETLLPSLQVGIEDPGSATEERVARRQAGASVVDAVLTKANRLQQVLPASDRSRLSDYLDNVREVERRMQLAAKRTTGAPSMDMPFGPPPSIDEHIKLIWDLQLLAFQADITRVSALLFCRDESSTSYPESGVLTSNHPASHHGEDPKRREEWAKINRYHQKTFAAFLKKMKETQDGDGNLLDHSLILWTSNMGNANLHSHTNVGQLLVGGASGAHKPKLNVNADGSTANFLVTTLNIMGIPAERHGDSTGIVSLS